MKPESQCPDMNEDLLLRKFLSKGHNHMLMCMESKNMKRSDCNGFITEITERFLIDVCNS